MTGRRPVTQWDARLSRALQFVPGHVGGRVASAQPIRRRGGTLRTPSVGAAGQIEPADMDHVGTIGGSMSTAGATSEAMTTTNAATGRAALVVATAADVTVSAPSGWTVLGSGTVGSLSWVVAWTVDTGSTDYTLTADGTGYDTSTFYGHIAYTLTHWDYTGTIAPHLYVATAAAAGSVDPIYAPATYAQRIAHVAALDAVGWVANIYSAAAITRPSTSWSFHGVTGGAGYRTHQMFRLRPVPSVPDGVPFTSSEPTNTDWLAACVGWATT